MCSSLSQFLCEESASLGTSNRVFLNACISEFPMQPSSTKVSYIIGPRTRPFVFHALTINEGHYIRNQRSAGTLCALNAVSWGRVGRRRSIHRCLRNRQPRQIGWERLYSLISVAEASLLPQIHIHIPCGAGCNKKGVEINSHHLAEKKMRELLKSSSQEESK